VFWLLDIAPDPRFVRKHALGEQRLEGAVSLFGGASKQVAPGIGMSSSQNNASQLARALGGLSSPHCALQSELTLTFPPASEHKGWGAFACPAGLTFQPEHVQGQQAARLCGLKDGYFGTPYARAWWDCGASKRRGGRNFHAAAGHARQQRRGGQQ